MIVKLSTESIELSIELLDKQSPLACRFFQQQLAKNAWISSSIQTVTDQLVIIGDAKALTLKLAKSNAAKFNEAGLVAFSKNSDRQIIIHRSRGAVDAGAVIGRLTEKSQTRLEDYLSQSLRKRRRLATEKQQSEQLKAVIRFQKRLAAIRKSQQTKEVVGENNAAKHQA